VKGFSLYRGPTFQHGQLIKVPVQAPLADIEVADTLLRRMDGPAGLTSYRVTHYMVEQVEGRVRGQAFTEYARKEEFNLYVREADGLIIAAVRHPVAEDVTRIIRGGEIAPIQALAVDLKTLRQATENVTGGYFRFADANLRASAYFGTHLENSPEFQEAERRGQIGSLLLFHEWNNAEREVRITSKCGVVLLQRYADTGIELEIVLGVFDRLDELGVVTTTLRKTRLSPRAVTHVSAGTVQTLLPQFEELVETEPES
jgi:hypothetical protein